MLVTHDVIVRSKVVTHLRNSFNGRSLTTVQLAMSLIYVNHTIFNYYHKMYFIFKFGYYRILIIVLGFSMDTININ